MRAIQPLIPGPPEVLELQDLPVPIPSCDEVLISVRAAGINRPDCLQRAGRYPPPLGASPILGLEVAGEVVSCGTEVVWPRPGMQVCALLSGGGYAEFAVTPAKLCLPIPSGLSLIEAAALPETCFTVWSNVFERARLRPGETLLVQGGASGIGTTAIQLARALGSPVFATAGTPEKCALCVQLGAQRAICYRTEDFASVIREATSERGVDVILDMVAGPILPSEIEILADDGRLVIIATQGGVRAPPLDMGTIMRRRLSLTGSTLRPRPLEFKAALAREVQRVVWPLLESGQFRPVINATFPLEHAASAHRLMESGSLHGKLVLTIDS